MLLSHPFGIIVVDAEVSFALQNYYLLLVFAKGFGLNISINTDYNFGMGT